MNPLGRPSKYTAETVQILCDCVADGLPFKAACKAAGISQETFSKWRETHSELAGAIDEAREAARREVLRKIKAAGEKDWRAWEAWLKFAFPEDYRVKAENIQAVQVNASPGYVLTRERLAEFQARIAAASV